VITVNTLAQLCPAKMEKAWWRHRIYTVGKLSARCPTASLLVIAVLIDHQALQCLPNRPSIDRSRAAVPVENHLLRIPERTAKRMAAFPVSNLKYIHNVMDFCIYIQSVLTGS
jgi:hypothetical protein